MKRILRRTTVTQGESHASIKSRRRSSGGDGRHQLYRSGQAVDAAVENQPAASPKDLPVRSDVTAQTPKDSDSDNSLSWTGDARSSSAAIISPGRVLMNASPWRSSSRARRYDVMPAGGWRAGSRLHAAMCHTHFADSDGAVILGVMTPGHFETLFRELGVPAQKRTLPPADAVPFDVARVIAAQEERGTRVVGPPLAPADA